MKKLLSILLTGILFCSLSIGVLAANDSRLVATNGYFFAIQETMDENHVVTRSYHGGETLTRSAPDLERTKALLISLGWTQEMVEQLPVETLQELAQSTDIVATAAYSKRDEATGAIVNLPEATARAEAAAIEEAREERFLQQALGEAPSITPFASDTYQDSYMYLIHTVSIQPDRDYLCMTDAQWLTMPLNRFTDFIGSCIYDFIPYEETASGYFQYTENSYNSVGQLTQVRKTGSLTDIDLVTNEGWNGMGGFLNLPWDTGTSSGSVFYRDLYAHFQFKAEVHEEVFQHVSSIGSYQHARIGLDLSFSVSPGPSGDADIGFTISTNTDTYKATVHFDYYP